jgi:ribosomal small subunit protein bTHX
MGKGDITTRRGKIFNHSFGVYKPRRKEITNHKKTSTREHPVYLNKRKNLDLTQAATLLSRKIRLIEQNMANMLGMKIFTSENGFTQEQLYNYSGRTDDVLTITFTKGSASEKKFGEEITIILLYSLEERKKLEANSSAMNSIKFAKAKYLGTELGQNQVQELQSTGFNTNDIKEIIVSQFTKENNTFPSKQLRSTEVLDIYLEAEGCGKDIGWIYGALCRRKNNKIGLMPDDEAKYLAYKTIIANNELTEEERNSIFDKNNKIYNQEVAYYYLLWKKQ